MESNLVEVNSSNRVSGDNFKNGTQSFNWHVGAPQTMNLSKSYFRVTAEILGGLGAQPLIHEQLAFSDNFVGNLYQNIHMRGGGVDMSSQTSYAEQASALKTRLDSSHGWFKTLGETQLSEADFSKRCLAVSNDKAVSNGLYSKNDIYSLAQPASFTTATVFTVDAVSDEALGFSLINEYAYTASDLTINFTDGAGPSIPVVSAVFPVGSSIRFTSGNNIIGEVRFVAASTATTITLASSLGASNINVATIESNGKFERFYPSGTDGLLHGANTNFLDDDVGSTIVVNNVPYVIEAVDDQAQTLLTSPVPSSTASSVNFYGVRRDMLRTTNGRNKVMAMWKPPLALFDHDAPMPAGDYNISLTPNAAFRLTGVETRNPNNKADLASYRLNILDVKLYVYVEKAVVLDENVKIRLTECLVQSKIYTPSLPFTVPSSTRAITVFMQGPEYGHDARYSPSMFKTADDTDLNLRTLQVTFNSQTKTSIPWDSEFATNTPVGRNVNLMYQRYRDTYTAAGVDVDAVGCEDFDSWLKRGGIYHFTFERDSSCRSNEVNIQAKFTTIDPSAKLYCAAWYDVEIHYTTSSGRILNVTRVMTPAPADPPPRI